MKYSPLMFAVGKSQLFPLLPTAQKTCTVELGDGVALGLFVCGTWEEEEGRVGSRDCRDSFQISMSVCFPCGGIT